MMKKILASSVVIAGVALLAAQTLQAKPTMTAAQKQVVDAISADSMRGHLSFIASDLLEGRATPSKGLDIAAEYIAAQFRRAGVQPAVGESYFQMTTARASRNSTETAPVKNVLGIIRGSDPVLKDTYIIVSAHYDHTGVLTSGEGDRINNGANDNGSGTVSVMELASALTKYKPKRSIVFALWYGEERGLVGSRFYAQNPIFPLDKTIAMINLEQVGRTDDNEGPRVGAVAMTGQDYTDVGPILENAGQLVGVKVEKHLRNSDAFFGRSDNQALADAGVPAHTICTAFEYPDYHRPGDHWEKIDYENMAKVNRLVALGVMMMADSPTEPKWNEANPRTGKYVTAWKALKGR